MQSKGEGNQQLETAPAFQRYTDRRWQVWESNAAAIQFNRYHWSRAYHRRLEDIYQAVIPPGQRVLEVGCSTGDLLAAVAPALGVGIDFSETMLVQAAEKYPHLCFLQADAHRLPLYGSFDVIILSDLVNDLWDVQTVFEQLAAVVTPHTRVVINSHSRLWEIPLGLARLFGLAQGMLVQNWLTREDIINLLNLTGYEVIRAWSEVLWPLETPPLNTLLNRYLVKIWPFSLLALTNVLVARPLVPIDMPQEPLVSVIIPARNEVGNIDQAFTRVPEMGRGTELIFVEGHSRDDTYAAIERAMEEHPERDSRLFQQTGQGKGDAVRLGFAQARGEVLMILDADLTVPPEDLPRFYDALRTGKGEFINGVRLIYPMEEQAMRYLNLLGNKFFSVTFSWLLGQPIKDTLCGTKVLWKSDYEQIAANRAYFGDFDPFGDFDLLFGAIRLNRKILDLPIRYRERTYGATNIQRWKHGMLLLRMVLFASRRIKFL
jgi:ubiquinone/menaquinone biosynthesis C-methylase UbiE